MCDSIDVLEDYIESRWPGVLEELLLDHTKHHRKLTSHGSCNIVWATDSYTSRGKDYAPDYPILLHLITGNNGHVIQPRAAKTREEQTARTKGKAEVFTPAWICNAQNNLVDNAWFGTELENQFNCENPDHTWTTKHEPIKFPDGKTWRSYVRAPRMELTCGEAPYLCSRYDAVSGQQIPVEERIGLLDRKLRVVSENTTTSGDWLEWAKIALRSTYGYEYQGDSLLIARETAFMTFIDFYQQKFGRDVPQQSIPGIAYIISWNLWQMDGLTGCVPYLKEAQYTQGDLFATVQQESKSVQCLVRDWSASDKTRQITVFQSNKPFVEPNKS